MNHAYNHLDNGTDMSTLKPGAGATTDVWFYAKHYGGCCWHGMWDCEDVNSAGECESGDAKLNRSNLDGEGEHAKEHTACHEIGHSTGLDHAYEVISCMRQGIDEPKWLADHDKNHINDRW